MSVNATVLYAEDDENDAFFMQRAFARVKQPGALRIVPNGRRAVEYLSSTGDYPERGKHPSPTVVILDIKMPEMSGLEVLRWMRERPEFATIPVVIFTSSTQNTDLTFARTHGANAFVTKPANADNLATLVEQILATTAAAWSAGKRLEIAGNLV